MNHNSTEGKACLELIPIKPQREEETQPISEVLPPPSVSTKPQQKALRQAQSLVEASTTHEFDPRAKAARKIQVFYRANLAGTRLAHTANVGKTEVEVHRLSSRGAQIGKIYVIVSFTYNKKLAELRVSIYNIESRRTHEFVVSNFCYEDMAPEQFEYTVGKILSGVEYIPEADTFCSGLTKELSRGEKLLGVRPAQEAHSPSPGFMREAYSGSRKFASGIYRVSVLLHHEKAEMEICLSKEDGKEEEPVKLKVQEDLTQYLKVNPAPNKEVTLGAMASNFVELLPTGEFWFDEAKLHSVVLEQIQQAERVKLVKLQARFRACLARRKLLLMVELHSKKLRTLEQFGLRMGKHYHLIKVLVNIQRKDSVFIRSDKAQNTLEIRLAKLRQNETIEEDGSDFAIKQLVRSQLPKLIAFHAGRKVLVLHERRAM